MAITADQLIVTVAPNADPTTEIEVIDHFVNLVDSAEGLPHFRVEVVSRFLYPLAAVVLVDGERDPKANMYFHQGVLTSGHAEA